MRRAWLNSTSIWIFFLGLNCLENSVTEVWVTLKGTGPSSLSIQFKLTILENPEYMTVPIWTNFKKVFPPSGVNSTSPGSIKRKIINFMAIPPLIANSLDSSTSMQPLNVIVHCLVATNRFDSKTKGFGQVYKAWGRSKRSLKNVLVSEHEKSPTTIYIYSLDPQVL